MTELQPVAFRPFSRIRITRFFSSSADGESGGQRSLDEFFKHDPSEAKGQIRRNSSKPNRVNSRNRTWMGCKGSRVQISPSRPIILGSTFQELAGIPIFRF